MVILDIFVKRFLSKIVNCYCEECVGRSSLGSAPSIFSPTDIIYRNPCGCAECILCPDETKYKYSYRTYYEQECIKLCASKNPIYKIYTFQKENIFGSNWRIFKKLLDYDLLIKGNRIMKFKDLNTFDNKCSCIDCLHQYTCGYPKYKCYKCEPLPENNLIIEYIEKIWHAYIDTSIVKFKKKSKELDEENELKEIDIDEENILLLKNGMYRGKFNKSKIKWNRYNDGNEIIKKIDIFWICSDNNPNEFYKSRYIFLNMTKTEFIAKLYNYKGISIFTPSKDPLYPEIIFKICYYGEYKGYTLEQIYHNTAHIREPMLPIYMEGEGIAETIIDYRNYTNKEIIETFDKEMRDKIFKVLDMYCRNCHKYKGACLGHEYPERNEFENIYRRSSKRRFRKSPPKYED